MVPRLTAEAHLIRYADDFVLVFREAQDAYLVFDQLAQRFAEFGLKLHPDKTRLVHFRPPPWGPSGKGRLAPRSLDFLGFNYHWGRSRKGAWVVKQKTARSRFTRTMHRISKWCRKNRHRPIDEQHAHLVRQLRGYDAYFRHPRQLPRPGKASIRGGSGLATVAGSPLAQGSHGLGPFRASAETIPASAAEAVPGRRARVANPYLEEPDALDRARPDLWEPWVGNHPGPPGT